MAALEMMETAMRNMLRVVGMGVMTLLLALLVLTGHRAEAASRLAFVLKNRTGQTITSVYLKPHHETQWSRDLLSIYVLKDNQNITLDPDTDEDVDLWDVCVKTRDGVRHTWQEPGFNLATTSSLTIYVSRDQFTAVANR